MASVSVVIPAYNEEGAVAETVHAVRDAFERTGHALEIIVVNDGSRDATGDEAHDAGAIVINHPVNIGYGNAILSGMHAARHEYVALTDADGTYPVARLPDLLERCDTRGLDMLVGARKGRHYHGPMLKRVARRMFRWLAEFSAGQRIDDINSGMRIIRRDLMLEFSPVACGGFSYTTTITVISLLTSRFVEHTPIEYNERKGDSKISYPRDTLRSAQILVMAILLYNPIKLFLLGAVGAGAMGIVLAAAAVAIGAPATALLLIGIGGLGATVMLAVGLLADQRRYRAPARHGHTEPVLPAGGRGGDGTPLAEPEIHVGGARERVDEGAAP